MLFFVWACAEPVISVWGRMDTGEAEILWDSVTFHIADTPWDDPWLPIALLDATATQLSTKEVMLAQGSLPVQKYHHVFTDANLALQDEEEMEDIIEQIAAPFVSDRSHRIIVEYTVIDKRIFAKDCIVDVEWF